MTGLDESGRLMRRTMCILGSAAYPQFARMSVTALPSTKPRISTKVRDAVEYRVREGLSIVAAAEKAGMSRNGFAKALKRPAVQDLLRETQERFVIESEAARSVFKAQALEVALDLMLNAKSEAVRARMVEFLAGDGKQPQVAVHVDARAPGGYFYPPKGAKIVDVVEGEAS